MLASARAARTSDLPPIGLFVMWMVWMGMRRRHPRARRARPPAPPAPAAALTFAAALTVPVARSPLVPNRRYGRSWPTCTR